MTTSIDTIVIGGGQAGLALSHYLTASGHDHIVIERGRVAERWHSERWDSLRLLTPNWMTRLPGWKYTGPDLDGFMTAAEVADFFAAYAASFDAPVLDQTTVQRVGFAGDGFSVVTDTGAFRSNSLVIATGWCDQPSVPEAARLLAPDIVQINPSAYRRPDDLPAGGVLVVGASATGVQLASEIQASGRDVTIAVGRHSRMPRRYRGMDVFWWLDVIGAFDRTIDDVGDAPAARNEPSLQLVGRPDHSALDLATLQGEGVRLVGRLDDIDGTRLTLATDLDMTLRAADLQTSSVLGRIDRYIDHNGLATEVLDAEPILSVRSPHAPPSLDLRAAGIETVIWATGHRRPYEWLHLPIRDGRGEIRQHRGITPLAGVYVLGQRFQHFRNSNFIDGVGRDAAYVADHIRTHRSHRPTRSVISLFTQKRAEAT